MENCVIPRMPIRKGDGGSPKVQNDPLWAAMPMVSALSYLDWCPPPHGMGHSKAQCLVRLWNRPPGWWETCHTRSSIAWQWSKWSRMSQTEVAEFKSALTFRHFCVCHCTVHTEQCQPEDKSPKRLIVGTNTWKQQGQKKNKKNRSK